MRLLLPLILLFFSPQWLSAQSMDNARMDSIFRVVLDSVTGAPGRWELTIGDFKMLCLTDESHDRMRIITPVQRLEDATPEEIYKCLEANFHTALDVKYAIADDMIWVAFIHPLGSLQDDQLIDALKQVRSAALTYGTIYTSTDLVFPKPEGEQQETKPKTKEPPVIRG
ncbi:MAG: type III secretion system chaperone [Bacteroidota bacterium]